MDKHPCKDSDIPMVSLPINQATTAYIYKLFRAPLVILSI